MAIEKGEKRETERRSQHRPSEPSTGLKPTTTKSEVSARSKPLMVAARCRRERRRFFFSKRKRKKANSVCARNSQRWWVARSRKRCARFYLKNDLKPIPNSQKRNKTEKKSSKEMKIPVAEWRGLLLEPPIRSWPSLCASLLTGPDFLFAHFIFGHVKMKTFLFVSISRLDGC